MRTALSNQHGEIRHAGDPELATILASAWKAAQDDEPDSLTHGFHSWPARMHPSIPGTILQAVANEHTRVLDPFSGSGTVCIEAMVRGLRAAGVDLNPLAERVAAVKCQVRVATSRSVFVRKAERLTRASLERVQTRDVVRAPVPTRIFTQFDTHVAKEMAGLLELIQLETDPEDKLAFEVVFSSLVTKFSKRESDTSLDEVKKNLRKGLFSEFFVRKSQELSERWEELMKGKKRNSIAPKFFTGTLQSVRLQTKADIVITSPPYGGVYNYAEHHELRLAWLGLPIEPLQHQEVGARRGAGSAQTSLPMAEREKLWDEQLYATLGEIGRNVNPKGLAFVVLGDAQFAQTGGVRSAIRQVEAGATSVGYRVLASASQARRLATGVKKEEHIIALQF